MSSHCGGGNDFDVDDLRKVLRARLVTEHELESTDRLAEFEDAIRADERAKTIREVLQWCDANSRTCEDHGCLGAWELEHGEPKP